MIGRLDMAHHIPTYMEYGCTHQCGDECIIHNRLTQLAECGDVYSYTVPYEQRVYDTC